MAYDLVARLRLIDNMTAPLKRATGQLGGVGKMAAGVSTAIAGIGAAVGAVAVVGSSLNKAMDFESQLSSIQAVGGVADTEMSKIQKLALEMGAKTKYSALEAAQGMEELIKAGMTVPQVMGGGLEAALNLAAAGDLKLADSAEIMSTAMNAFKRDALSAEQAANILAGTANASATSVEDLRYSLAMVSAVASGIGMSFHDTNAALGLFANNGLKGSDAGTSLKTALQNLQPVTKDQIGMFKALGLMTKDGANKFFDANGKLQDLESIAGTLRSSLKNLTDQKRALALETIFGADATRAGNILFNEGAEGVRKFNNEMEKTTALQVATQRMDNAKGAMEQFKGAVETFQIAALLPTMPLIKKLALAAADMASRMTTWLDSSQAKRWGATLQNIFSTVATYIGGVVKVLSGDYSGGGKMLEKVFGKDGGKTVFMFLATLRETFMTVFNTVKQIITDAIPVVRDNMGKLAPVFEAVKSILRAVQDAFRIFGPIVSDIFATVFPIAVDLVGKLSKAISWLIENVVRPLLPVLGTYVENTWKVMKPILEAMKVAFDKVAEAIAWAADKYEKFQGSGAAKVLKGDFKLGLPEWAGGNGIVQLNKDGGSGHSAGLNRVPYDGYMARLHKGERVLTNEEAKATSTASGGSSFVFSGTVNINGASGNISEMGEEFMRYIAQKMNEAGGLMAGGGVGG